MSSIHPFYRAKNVKVVMRQGSNGFETSPRRGNLIQPNANEVARWDMDVTKAFCALEGQF